MVDRTSFEEIDDADYLAEGYFNGILAATDALEWQIVDSGTLTDNTVQSIDFTSLSSYKILKLICMEVCTYPNDAGTIQVTFNDDTTNANYINVVSRSQEGNPCDIITNATGTYEYITCMYSYYDTSNREFFELTIYNIDGFYKKVFGNGWSVHYTDQYQISGIWKDTDLITKITLAHEGATRYFRTGMQYILMGKI